jgi:hypothetical protein
LQVETVVDERVLQQWGDLTDQAPKVSLGAFLAAVASADKQYGGQVIIAVLLLVVSMQANHDRCNGNAGHPH